MQNRTVGYGILPAKKIIRVNKRSPRRLIKLSPKKRIICIFSENKRIPASFIDNARTGKSTVHSQHIGITSNIYDRASARIKVDVRTAFAGVFRLIPAEQNIALGRIQIQGAERKNRTAGRSFVIGKRRTSANSHIAEIHNSAAV